MIWVIIRDPIVLTNFFLWKPSSHPSCSSQWYTSHLQIFNFFFMQTCFSIMTFIWLSGIWYCIYMLLPKSVYFYSEDKITNDVLNKIFLNEIWSCLWWDGYMKHNFDRKIIEPLIMEKFWVHPSLEWVKIDKSILWKMNLLLWVEEKAKVELVIWHNIKNLLR